MFACQQLVPTVTTTAADTQCLMDGPKLNLAYLQRASLRLIERLAFSDADAAVAGRSGEEAAEVAFDAGGEVQDLFDGVIARAFGHVFSGHRQRIKPSATEPALVHLHARLQPGRAGERRIPQGCSKVGPGHSKPENRNPKSEGNPQPENRKGPAARPPFGFLISAFGLRISGLQNMIFPQLVGL